MSSILMRVLSVVLFLSCFGEEKLQKVLLKMQLHSRKIGIPVDYQPFQVNADQNISPAQTGSTK